MSRGESDNSHHRIYSLPYSERIVPPGCGRCHLSHKDWNAKTILCNEGLYCTGRSVYWCLHHANRVFNTESENMHMVDELVTIGGIEPCSLQARLELLLRHSWHVDILTWMDLIGIQKRKSMACFDWPIWIFAFGVYYSTMSTALQTCYKQNPTETLELCITIPKHPWPSPWSERRQT